MYTPAKIPVAWEGGGGFSLGGFAELGKAIDQYKEDGTLMDGFKLISIAALNEVLKKGINEEGYTDVELIRE